LIELEVLTFADKFDAVFYDFDSRVCDFRVNAQS